MTSPRRFLLQLATGAAVIACAGCANNRSGAASANANQAATTYSGNDLQKTGKRTSGDALQAADPAVTASGGH